MIRSSAHLQWIRRAAPPVAFVIACSALFARPDATAAGLAPLPSAGQRVSDAAGVLSDSERGVLEELSRGLEDRKGSQLAVVLVASTAPETIEAYSLRLAEAWAVGRAGVDDGVIVLAAIEDRRVRIEVGYGLEGAIPDAAAKRIISDEIVPRFRTGDYGAGLAAAMQALIERIDPEALPPPGFRERGENFLLENRVYVDDYFIPYIFLAFALSALIGMMRKSFAWGLLLPLALIGPVAALIALFLHVEHLIIAGALYVPYALIVSVAVDRMTHGWSRRGSAASGSYSGGSYSSSSYISSSYSGSSSSSWGGGGGSFGGGGASGSW